MSAASFQVPEGRQVDLVALEHELAAMKPRSALYELVKAEMVKRRRWKQLPRGKAFQRGQDKRRRPPV